MRFANPIILKELIQAAHRRRTFVVRAALPLIGVLLLVPQLITVLEIYGRDWRALADVFRPLFNTCMWLALVALPLLAFVYVTSMFSDEWTNKTIEVLCASPLSRIQIVWGKFLVGTGRVVAAALVLGPIVGVLFHAGHVPRDTALGALAVIGGAMAVCASVALVQAAAFRPRRTVSAGFAAVLAPYLLLLVFARYVAAPDSTWLKAAVPWTALDLMLARTPPTGLSMAAFTVRTLAWSGAVSLAAILPAPWLFGRAFNRHVTGRRPFRLGRIFRGAEGRKKRAFWYGAHPFFWQEAGAATAIVRRAPWAVYAVTGLFLTAQAVVDPNPRRDEAYVLGILVLEGLIIHIAAAAVYGAAVFAREKSRRTAEALLLTGHRPLRFFVAKVLAVYWALRYALLTAAMMGFILASIESMEKMEALLIAELLLLGPAAGVVIGMTFSVLARSPGRAVLAMLATVVWLFVLVWLLALCTDHLGIADDEPEIWLVGSLAVTGGLVLVMPQWTAWRLSVLLAFLAFTAMLGMATVIVAVQEKVYGTGYDTNEMIMLAACSGIAWVWLAVWGLIGLRVFDAGIAGRPARILPAALVRALRVRRRRSVSTEEAT